MNIYDDDLIHEIEEVKEYLSENSNLSFWSRNSNRLMLNNNIVSLPTTKEYIIRLVNSNE